MSRAPAPKDDQPDPDALGVWTDRLGALQGDHPDLAGARISEVIRHVPGKRAILRGQLGEHDAVFRFFRNVVKNQ